MIFIYLIGLFVAYFSITKAGAKGASGQTLAPASPESNIGQSQMRYTTPRSPVPVSASPAADYGTGAKPSGIMTGISKASGSVTLYTSNCSEIRGIDIGGAVIFDMTNVLDGHNSAVYQAGAILDHVDFLGPGGTSRLQIYFPTEDTSGPSTGLLDTNMVPVGQTASVDSSGLPYPAGDPNYNLPKPSSNGAFDPANSWFI